MTAVVTTLAPQFAIPLCFAVHCGELLCTEHGFATLLLLSPLLQGPH